MFKTWDSNRCVEDVSQKKLWLQLFQRTQSPLIIKMDLPVELKRKNTIATFQASLRVLLLAGQFFSLIPVYRISSKRVSDVKYVRLSWKCMYAFFSIFGQIFMASMSIRKFYNSDPSLSSTTSIVFYGSSWLTMLMFLKIAKRWPKLVRYISKIEQLYPSFDTELVNKCSITCVVILSVSLLEHLLSLVPDVLGGNTCTTPKPVNSYEAFLKHLYPWIFNLLPFHLLLGMMFQFFQIQSTFVWNFSDMFVICISYYLTSRLELVNKKLLDAHGKHLPEAFWRSIREEYGRTTQLVRRMDDVINGIVFVSFANNLFFICLQLYYSLENGFRGQHLCNPRVSGSSSTTSYIIAGYFLFSLTYLIIRSVAVSLIAAQVNTASTVPAQVLYDVPSGTYCKEVQRFLSQMSSEKVALSGLQFFSVTRGLLLTVAGTIVTYELVMFQINSPSPQPSATTTTTAVTTQLFNSTTPESFTVT